MTRKKGLSEIELIKYRIGIETISQIALINHAIKRNPIPKTQKGILGFLDSLSTQIKKQNIRSEVRPLELKIKIHGKEFIQECVLYAMAIAKAVDFDIYEAFDLKNEREIKQLINKK